MREYSSSPSSGPNSSLSITSAPPLTVCSIIEIRTWKGDGTPTLPARPVRCPVGLPGTAAPAGPPSWPAPGDRPTQAGRCDPLPQPQRLCLRALPHDLPPGGRSLTASPGGATTAPGSRSRTHSAARCAGGPGAIRPRAPAASIARRSRPPRSAARRDLMGASGSTGGSGMSGSTRRARSGR